MKANLCEKGKPCAGCPWPNDPAITPAVRQAAQQGAWFACHVNLGTCYGALAISKRVQQQGEKVVA